MKSPGMYFSHVAYFFKAMMSAGMMIGVSDLSVLMHMKSKSPAIGKETGTSLPAGDRGTGSASPGGMYPKSAESGRGLNPSVAEVA